MAEYGVTFSHSRDVFTEVPVEVPYFNKLRGRWSTTTTGEHRPFVGWQEAFLFARATAAAQPGVEFEVVKRESGGEWREANGRGELAATLPVLRQARGWV